MTIQIPAQAVSVWQYILKHPITWAGIGILAGFVCGHLHFPF